MTGDRRPMIASARNPSVRRARELRDRRARDRTGLTIIDGIREAARALEAGVRIEECLVDAAGPSGPAGEALLGRLGEARVPLVRVARPVLDRIAYGDRSDGIVAIAASPDASIARLRVPPDALVVVLERTEKPGNLGAVLRSADAAGADAVIAADPVTDLFNPNVIRASLGTVFTVPLAVGTSDEVRGWLAVSGIRAVAARPDASRPYLDADLTGPVAMVLGSEAEGLGDAWLGDEIEAVRIPMLGGADSLNVSVVAAVLLYEARRQRGLASTGAPGASWGLPAT